MPQRFKVVTHEVRKAPGVEIAMFGLGFYCILPMWLYDASRLFYEPLYIRYVSAYDGLGATRQHAVRADMPWVRLQEPEKLQTSGKPFTHTAL